MKKLKVTLSSLAFISAITFSFAFFNVNADVNPIQQLYSGTFNGGCYIVGELQEDPQICKRTNIGPPCTITIFNYITNAYEGRINGVCVNPLFKPL